MGRHVGLSEVRVRRPALREGCERGRGGLVRFLQRSIIKCLRVGVRRRTNWHGLLRLPQRPTVLRRPQSPRGDELVVSRVRRSGRAVLTNRTYERSALRADDGCGGLVPQEEAPESRVRRAGARLLPGAPYDWSLVAPRQEGLAGAARRSAGRAHVRVRSLRQRHVERSAAAGRFNC